MNRKFPLVAALWMASYLSFLPVVVSLRDVTHVDDPFAVVMRSDAACARRPGLGCATTPIEHLARYFSD